MSREVKLSRVNSVLEELTYPISRSNAAFDVNDVTLLLADGEENLGALVEQLNDEEFESADELASEINNVLPREAVGEPYQSEGEG